MNRNGILYILVLFVFFGCTHPKKARLTFDKMLVEYSENPLNIDEQQPRFSWFGFKYAEMLGYAMDCPQRDERLSWFDDAQVTAEEAMFNFNKAQFYENWFEGIKDNQDTKSGDLPIISPQPYILNGD